MTRNKNQKKKVSSPLFVMDHPTVQELGFFCGLKEADHRTYHELCESLDILNLITLGFFKEGIADPDFDLHIFDFRFGMPHQKSFRKRHPFKFDNTNQSLSNFKCVLDEHRNAFPSLVSSCEQYQILEPQKQQALRLEEALTCFKMMKTCLDNNNQTPLESMEASSKFDWVDFMHKFKNLLDTVLEIFTKGCLKFSEQNSPWLFTSDAFELGGEDDDDHLYLESREGMSMFSLMHIVSSLIFALFAFVVQMGITSLSLNLFTTTVKVLNHRMGLPLTESYGFQDFVGSHYGPSKSQADHAEAVYLYRFLTLKDHHQAKVAGPHTWTNFFFNVMTGFLPLSLRPGESVVRVFELCGSSSIKGLPYAVGGVLFENVPLLVSTFFCKVLAKRYFEKEMKQDEARRKKEQEKDQQEQEAAKYDPQNFGYSIDAQFVLNHDPQRYAHLNALNANSEKNPFDSVTKILERAFPMFSAMKEFPFDAVTKTLEGAFPIFSVMKEFRGYLKFLHLADLALLVASNEFQLGLDSNFLYSGLRTLLGVATMFVTLFFPPAMLTAVRDLIIAQLGAPTPPTTIKVHGFIACILVLLYLSDATYGAPSDHPAFRGYQISLQNGLDLTKPNPFETMGMTTQVYTSSQSIPEVDFKFWQQKCQLYKFDASLGDIVFCPDTDSFSPIAIEKHVVNAGPPDFLDKIWNWAGLLGHKGESSSIEHITLPKKELTFEQYQYILSQLERLKGRRFNFDESIAHFEQSVLKKITLMSYDRLHHQSQKKLVLRSFQDSRMSFDTVNIDIPKIYLDVFFKSFSADTIIQAFSSGPDILTDTDRSLIKNKFTSGKDAPDQTQKQAISKILNLPSFVEAKKARGFLDQDTTNENRLLTIIEVLFMSS